MTHDKKFQIATRTIKSMHALIFDPDAKLNPNERIAFKKFVESIHDFLDDMCDIVDCTFCEFFDNDKIDHFLDARESLDNDDCAFPFIADNTNE